MIGRRLAGVVAAAVLLGSTAAACSDPPDTLDPAAVKGLDSGSSSVRAPSDEIGGTLKLVAGAVDSLDPARSYSPGVWNLMRLYTRQLVTYAPSPGDKGTTLVPDLATSLGRVSNGGKTWTYTLRAGLRWENGRPITARDVKYGIERLFASDVINGGPTWAVQLLDVRNQLYDGPYRDRTPGRLGLATIQTPNDQTIVFTLNRPFADFDKVMALPASSPVLAAKDSGKNYALAPVSAGPYKIAVDAKNGVLTLTRNPVWSNRIDSVRAALPDRIEVTTGLLPDERDRRVLSGEADADVTGAGLQPDAARKVLGDPALTARVDNPTTGTLRFVAMPANVAPFNDVHCRRAVQYALDKTAVKDALGGQFGAALATTLWPRSMPGYPAAAPYPGGEGNRGDLAKAKDELAQCKKPTGFSANLATVVDGRGKVAADVIAKSLARVGITVTIRPFQRADFVAKVAGSPAVVKAQNLGLIVGEWAADFPSPYGFLDPLVDGRSIRNEANPNTALLADPAIVKAVDAAAAAADPARATASWRTVVALAMTAGSYAPVVEDRALLIGSTRLRNAYVHPAYRGYDLASLGVA